MSAPLAQLSRIELEFLQKAIKRNQIPTPVSEIALKSLGKGALFPRLGPLACAPKEAALALLEYALAAPIAEPVAAGGAESALVWTGPEVHLSRARPTTAVVLELLQSARKSVLIAGYEFDHGAVLFEALHAAMRDHGVEVSIFLDVRRASTKKTNLDSYLSLQAYEFLRKNWPFGEPVPRLCYFPGGVQAGSYRSMHAKCIVVDGEHVLVGSANFTERGHERNIEVGVSTKDAALAQTLVDQFERLVDSGDLAVLPDPVVPQIVVPEAAEEENAEEVDELEEALGGPPADLLAILEDQLVHPSLWKFYSYVLERGLDAPEVGDDIEDGGDVIGTAELFWLDTKVAILMEEQLGCRRALESAGWSCFPSEEVYDRKHEIFDLLERGE